MMKCWFAVSAGLDRILATAMPIVETLVTENFVFPESQIFALCWTGSIPKKPVERERPPIFSISPHQSIIT